MQTYAIIKDGKVENVIDYESQPITPPPGFEDGYIAVQSDGVSPGWLYENGQFIDSNPVDPRAILQVKTLAEQILASPDDLAAFKKALGL